MYLCSRGNKSWTSCNRPHTLKSVFNAGIIKQRARKAYVVLGLYFSTIGMPPLKRKTHNLQSRQNCDRSHGQSPATQSFRRLRHQYPKRRWGSYQKQLPGTYAGRLVERRRITRQGDDTHKVANQAMPTSEPVVHLDKRCQRPAPSAPLAPLH